MSANRGRSDASGPSEADVDLSVFDDQGNLAAPARVGEHSLHVFGRSLHVDVLERDVPSGVVRTGRRGVRSGVLAEDQNSFWFHSERVIAWKESVKDCYDPRQ